MVESSDGVEIALHDLGGEGEPLLLAHATGFHAMVMQPLAERLDGFACWAPDLRGHGESITPETTTFDWKGFGDDILAVIDALGLSGIPAVGHSMGGAALLLAEQARPGTFCSLYLFEPVVFPRGLFAEIIHHDGTPPGDIADNPMSAGARRRRRVFESTEAALENFASKPPLAVLDDEVLRAYVEHGFTTRDDGSIHIRCNPDHEALIYMTGGTHDAFEHLGEVMCPVTIASGNNNVPGPGLLGEMIAGALPHGSLVTFDDLGHFGPLENPARVAGSIIEALDPSE